jgi:hypothetical protein
MVASILNIKLEKHGSKRASPQAVSQNLLEGVEENHDRLEDSVPVKIRSGYLPNTS